MNRNTKQVFSRSILIALLAGALLGAPGVAWSQTKASAAALTIVLDPGHGGADYGATGPSGVQEKTVCMALARELAMVLAPSATVLLTRTGDYNVDLRARTALANNKAADLFVSLHTGAAFVRAAQGTTVFAHQPADKQAPLKTSDPSRLPWHQLQIPHMEASTALAAAVRDRLIAIEGKTAAFSRQAPLEVLAGATMPAVLIEIGHLTHPDTETELTSRDQLKVIANAIAAGLRDYLASIRK